MLRSVLTALAVAVLAGACSNATPTPAVPSPTQAASPAVPTAAAPSAAASAPPASSDLKGLLPTKVGNVAFNVVQFTGPELEASGAVDAKLQGLLTTFGRDVKDLTMAIASDPTRASDLSVTAFRVRDVPMDTFLTGYVPLLRQNYGDSAVSQATRAGRQVYVATPPGGAPPQVLISKGDVLFVVAGSDAALVDQALGQLP